MARSFGVVLLLALIRWRQPEAWLIALLALVPQAGMAYDALPLAVIPRTSREAMFYATCTLLAVPFRHVAVGSGVGFTDATSANAPLYLVTLYLPALIMVLRRPNQY